MRQAPLFIALLCGAIAASPAAHGQVSWQPLTFSIYAQYSTNVFTTNRATSGVTTNQEIRTNYIDTRMVTRDIAVDLFGAGYTNWSRAVLLRETDVAGHEGIFLYNLVPPTNLNVSSFFGLSYSNDFAFETANNFTPITNMLGVTDFSAAPDYNEVPPIPASQLGDVTNFNFNVANPIASANYVLEKIGTNTVLITNFTTHAPGTVSVCDISLQTSNLQFNLLASGAAVTTNLERRLAGVTRIWTNFVDSVTLNYAVGTYRANFGTNLLSPIPAEFVSGPAHVDLPFGTGGPGFFTNSDSTVFP